MNCISCELTRAKIKAYYLWVIGESLPAIADKLSHDYGAIYYVAENGDLMRQNTVPPHKPYLIL